MSCEHRWKVTDAYTYEAMKISDTVCVEIQCTNCSQQRTGAFGIEELEVV